jgi:hypothetical protein
VNYTFKDAQQAMRAPLIVNPITDEQRDQCRAVLNAHDASDLADMLGVAG